MKRFLVVIFFVFFFVQCSRHLTSDSQKQTAGMLTVNFAPNALTESDYFRTATASESKPLFGSHSSVPSDSAPASVSDFNCYFVNTMGPSIGNWDGYSSATSTSPYGYFGEYSKLTSQFSGTALFKNIPPGETRIIQVLGVVTHFGCPETVTAEQLSSSAQYSYIAELARAQVQVNDNTTVNLVIDYNPLLGGDVRTWHDAWLQSVGDFFLEATPGDQNVYLDWDRAFGAVRYVVTRGLSPGPGAYSAKLNPNVTDTFYTDEGGYRPLTNGVRYYYTVTATNNVTGQTIGTPREVSAIPYGTPIYQTGVSYVTGYVNGFSVNWYFQFDNNGSTENGVPLSCSSSNLSPGLFLVTSGNQCIIYGTPTAPTANYQYGSFEFATITASNKRGDTQIGFYYRVFPQAPSIGYSPNILVGTAGTSLSISPTYSNSNGASVTNCTSSPALPSGLILNPTTCVISGVTHVTSSAQAYTIFATNWAGTSSTSVTLQINPGAPNISYNSGYVLQVGVPATIAPISFFNNGSTTTCALTGSLLPTGLAFTPASCQITGTPAAITTLRSYTITATNGFGSASASFTISVPSFAAAHNTSDLETDKDSTNLIKQLCNSSLFDGGTGSVQDPYRVSTRAHLQNIRQCQSAKVHFIQTADIDLLGETNPWTPADLSGFYDGNDHAIINLYVRHVSAAGLFAHLAASGEIKNVKLINADVQGRKYVGALVGKSEGLISACASSGVVGISEETQETLADVSLGGLVGEQSANAIRNASSSADVMFVYTEDDKDGIQRVGGLVGFLSTGASLQSSAASGDMLISGHPSAHKGTTHFGGLVADSIDSTIEQSYATGKIEIENGN